MILYWFIVALLPPATHSSSPWSSSLTSCRFREALTLLHPSLLLSSFLYSFTLHPPSVVPSPDSASFFSRHAALFPHQNKLTLSLPSFSFSLSLPCFTIHCASLPPRAPSVHKNLPPQPLYVVTYLSIALQLICQLVSLNCLRIYNLARRWARVCLSFQHR